MKSICSSIKPQKSLGITMILSSLILLNGLVIVSARAANSDYDGLSVEVSAGNGGDALGGQSALGESYDAALLETEIAADKQQNTLDSMEEVETEKTTNATAQVIEKRADTSYMDTEEYSDETESNEGMHMTTTHATPTTTEILYEMLITTTATSKSISKDYARKGKKQVYPTPASEDSEADYEEEDEQEASLQPEEHLEPFAMKYYDTDQNATEEEEDVPVQDSLEVHSNKIPEHQQLPVMHAVLPRFNINSFDAAHTDEQQTFKLKPTAIAVLPDYRQPIVVQAAPGLPAFLLSFTNAPPTKSSLPDNNQMTATPAPFTTQSTITTSAPLTTTTIISTTSRPVGKQGKQINIPTRRKLLPHEQLRNHIEDAYIRMPLAVIVDPSVESLQKTKALWHAALQTNLNIKIVLVALNDSGKNFMLFKIFLFVFLFACEIIKTSTKQSMSKYVKQSCESFQNRRWFDSLVLKFCEPMQKFRLCQ